MSDQVVLVPFMAANGGPIPPLLINNAMTKGTLIVNTDKSNSVWISSSPSMASGTGVRIGPAGSVTFIEDGPAYAILDNAASSSVVLTCTTTLTGIDNPVDVGVAVATQLLSSGVPSVFTNSVLGAYASVFGNTIAPGASVKFDIYKYATLTLKCESNPAAATAVQADFHSVPAGMPFDAIVASELFTSADPNASGLFAIPVIGSAVTLTNRGTNALQMYVYGSNRSLTGAQAVNIGGQNAARLFQTALFANPIAANTAKLFTNSDGGPDSTSFNNAIRCRIRAACSAVPTARPAFYIQMLQYDPAGLKSLSVVDSALFHVADYSAASYEWTGELFHPTAVVQWRAIVETAQTVGITFSMEVVPQ